MGDSERHLTAWPDGERYIYCPRCGKGKHKISHLKVGTSFGPWHCRARGCWYGFEGRVTPTGAVVTILEQRVIPTKVTLRTYEPITLVVQGLRFENVPGVAGGDDDNRFFYEENTCPINVLQRVIRVVDETGDADPHGVFTYVKTEELTDADYGDMLYER